MISSYEQQAIDFASKHKITLKILEIRYGKHFADDPKEQDRYIFKCRLSRNRRSYTFNFGQSIAKQMTDPSLYDIFCCMQKYNPGSFQEFRAEYGYEYTEANLKLYRRVKKEYMGMLRVFGESILEEMQSIQ